MTTVLHVLGWLLLAVGGGSVAFNACAYLSAARYRRRHPPTCPADAGDDVPPLARAVAATRAFAVECAVTALLVGTAPLGLRRLRVQRFAGGDPRHPVVLVHGYAQHSANFVRLARRLRRDGWLHLYSVAHAAAWGDIAQSGQRLSDAIDRILDESGAARVDIVAHSMGGLVARACLHARRGRGVARVITLGTPHGGTAIFSRLGHDPMLRQMRAGSPLLDTLSVADADLAHVDCTAIYSADDALVVPASAGYWPGAFNVQVQRIGHMSLLFSRRVYELVRENLAAPPVARRRAGRAS